MSLLDQNTTNKGRVDNQALPKPEKEFDIKDDKEYEIETIIDNAIYDQ